MMGTALMDFEQLREYALKSYNVHTFCVKGEWHAIATEGDELEIYVLGSTDLTKNLRRYLETYAKSSAKAVIAQLCLALSERERSGESWSCCGIDGIACILEHKFVKYEEQQVEYYMVPLVPKVALEFCDFVNRWHSEYPIGDMKKYSTFVRVQNDDN